MLQGLKLEKLILLSVQVQQKGKWCAPVLPGIVCCPLNHPSAPCASWLNTSLMLKNRNQGKISPRGQHEAWPPSPF